jgi:SAM-dependent methyltransferase
MVVGERVRTVIYEPQAYWSILEEERADLSVVGYPYLPVAFNAVLYRAMARAVEKAASELKPPPRSVLDVGSGTGFWVSFWRRLGVQRIVALDLAEGATAKLSRKFPDITVAQADITESLPVHDSFDVVSVMSVLLHVTDDHRFNRAVENLSSALRSGGFAVIIDPVVVHRYWGDPPGAHSNSKARSRAEWQRSLNRAGLQLVSVRPVTWLFAEPVDTRTRLFFRILDLYWNVLSRVIFGSEWRGRWAGRALARFDDALVALSRTGPSTKCVVVRKP